jgi:hypothetical protein
LPCILLQSLSRRCTDLQHSRQLGFEYRVPLRKKFRAIGYDLISPAFLCVAGGAMTNVHIIAEKGMTISNAIVTRDAFDVKAASGPPFIMLEHAKMQEK